MAIPEPTPLPARAAKRRMSTEIPSSITTPDRVETRLGTLRFFDGFPDEETVEKIYDNLDFQRGVQAFLTAMPAAPHHALRTGFRTFGPDNETLLITETLLDSHTLLHGGNSETIYAFGWLDTHEGPLVIEAPAHVLGFVNDLWGRYVTDLGHAGPDRGQGGRYLLLPPDHTGDVPEGYFVVRSRTFGNLLLLRGFVVDGDTRPAVENMKRHYRAYPLAHAADPPATTFVDISGAAFNVIHPSDASFFEAIAEVVHEEPLDAVDPETRGLLAAIGIRRDRPFAPDASRKRILVEAAAVGNATARALVFATRNPGASRFPDSAWQAPWIGDYTFSPGGVLDLDARTFLFYVGWGISPSMTLEMVGVGSQYAFAVRDAAGQYLRGGNHYRLHLPPNVPAKDFWSVLVYDPQTRSMLQTDQRFPSLSSQKEGIVVNPDTSVDLFFGPEPPAGREANWVQTIPGKGWYAGLRLYGPLEAWFDKTWRPGEFEPVD
jgi:hypothetical protein